MRHFIVSISFWRGVADRVRHKRTLRRACDWQSVPSWFINATGPKCDDCQAYVNQLRRMGVTVFQ